MSNLAPGPGETADNWEGKQHADYGHLNQYWTGQLYCSLWFPQFQAMSFNWGENLRSWKSHDYYCDDLINIFAVDFCFKLRMSEQDFRFIG